MSNSPTQQPDPAAPKAPPPWAFATSYAQPLPPALQFDPYTGFNDMADYMQTVLPGQYPGAHPRVCPVVATYPSGAIKKTWTGQTGQTPEEKAEYARGATLSAAAKHWTQQGVVGVVTSSLSSASELSQGANEWHTVAMARDGNRVFVHDAAYDAATHAGNVKRVDGVSGTGMVHRLVHTWPQVQGVYFQGPPSSYDPTQRECMGRSAQWVEATVNGTLPWPPNHDASGGVWTWHDRN
jgi:hypothetical protein